VPASDVTKRRIQNISTALLIFSAKGNHCVHVKVGHNTDEIISFVDLGKSLRRSKIPAVVARMTAIAN
jgi:hypothetical protein